MIPAWSELFRGRYAVYTLILNLGIGLHAIDVFVVATVMPAVVRDLGGVAFYTWSTTLYMMASIVAAACGGPVAAALGSRRGYVSAAVVFLAGSVGCALAPTMAVLLVSRAVQGAGGGLIIALSMVLLRELFPERIRTRALSSISAAWGVAAVLGPTIGGAFAEVSWWRGAFWFGVPVIVLFASLAWRVLPASEAAGHAPRLPVRRLMLLAGGVLSVAMSGNIEGLVLRCAFVGAAIGLVVQSFRLDGRAAGRLFPSRPLSLSGPVGTAYWMSFLFAMAHSPIGVFLPLIVQVLHGVSPLVAGYFNALMALAWTGAAVFTSGLQGVWVRVAIVLGPCLLLLGIAGQGAVVDGGPLTLFGGFVALTGLGIGLCHIHVVNWAMTTARRGEEVVTASSIPTIRALGIAFGAAFAGLVTNAAGLETGVSPMSVSAAANWLYGLLLILPASITLLALRLLRFERPGTTASARVPATPPGDR